MFSFHYSDLINRLHKLDLKNAELVEENELSEELLNEVLTSSDSLEQALMQSHEMLTIDNNGFVRIDLESPSTISTLAEHINKLSDIENEAKVILRSREYGW